MSAKNVLSFRSDTTIFSMRPRRSWMTFFSRSCVIGRGVVTFSIWSAIALASKTPTQIGRTRCPSLSRRMMMGILVIGSTIRPLIVISICMAHRLASEAIRVRAGNPHVHDPPDPLGLAGQVHHRVARRPPRQLPVAPPARRVDQDRLYSTDRRGEKLPLNALLQPLQLDDPPRLLVLPHVVRHPLQGERIGTRRVLEREHAVVAHRL